MNEIDAEELAVRRGTPDHAVRIVDVRSPDAYRRGHIPGSENVPMDELPDRAADFAGADTVVTVCPHGQASLQAARILGASEGLQQESVCSLAGGLAEWEGELESDDATPGEQPRPGQSEAPF